MIGRDEFNAMHVCAVIQFESGEYFEGFFLKDVEKTNVLANAVFFVIGDEMLNFAQKQLTIRGEYYQVVILGRVGALP